MRPARNSRPRSCFGYRGKRGISMPKKCFPVWILAWANWIRRENWRKLGIYECEICENFHIGHPTRKMLKA